MFFNDFDVFRCSGEVLLSVFLLFSLQWEAHVGVLGVLLQGAKKVMPRAPAGLLKALLAHRSLSMSKMLIKPKRNARDIELQESIPPNRFTNSTPEPLQSKALFGQLNIM